MWDESFFKQTSLCVVGNINRDLKTTPLPGSENLLGDGETSVAGIAETIGGGGANSAFAAAALGAKVSFMGKVGVDGLGRRLERTLTRHGVKPCLTKDPGQASGTSLALAFENGQRHFISCLPASRSLTFADIDLTALRGHRHLLRADIWFSEAMLDGGNLKLFQAAREANMDMSIDLNWDPRWGRASEEEIRARKESVRAVLPFVNLVHGNARELAAFAEVSDLATALERLCEWGAQAVVVHLGDKGAGFYQSGHFVVEPPATVQRRVNAAGTGDVLSVCMMLLHRCETVSIQERLRWANRIVADFMEGKREFIPCVEE